MAQKAQRSPDGCNCRTIYLLVFRPALCTGLAEQQHLLAVASLFHPAISKMSAESGGLWLITLQGHREGEMEM